MFCHQGAIKKIVDQISYRAKVVDSSAKYTLWIKKSDLCAPFVELITVYKQYLVLLITVAHKLLKMWINPNNPLIISPYFDIMVVLVLWIANSYQLFYQQAVDIFVNNFQPLCII